MNVNFQWLWSDTFMYWNAISKTQNVFDREGIAFPYALSLYIVQLHKDLVCSIMYFALKYNLVKTPYFLVWVMSLEYKWLYKMDLYWGKRIATCLLPL